MGLFNRKQKKQTRSIIKNYYGNDINYFTWNLANNIYNIPEVRTAIERYVNIFSTVPIWHKRVDKAGSVEYITNDAMHKVLTLKANPLQNATQFWNGVITNLFLYNNVFIEPIFDNNTGNLKQIFLLPNRTFNFELYTNSAWVQFYDGATAGRKYDMNNIIYLNRFSNIKGGEKNDLGLYETVLKSLGEQIVNVANPKKARAVLQGKAIGTGKLRAEDTVGTMAEVQASFDKNVNGLAYLDKTWTVTPINWTENDVNEKVMAYVTNLVYNYFGISEGIINNKATEIEMTLFVKNNIKPVADQIEREFTNKLFTDNEINYGNRIELDTMRLQVTTINNLTNLANSASRQGYMNLDEIREYFGQPPIRDGLGKMYRTSGDTINLEKVDEYQAAQKGVLSTTVKPVEDINVCKKEDKDE